MKLKFISSAISSFRVGIRSLKTGEFVRPPNRFYYVTNYGSFFYLSNNEILDIPGDDYEVFVSTGSRFLPVKQIVSCAGEKQISIAIEPKPFRALQAGHWYDADLHIHGPWRNEPKPRSIVAENIPLEIIAENMSFACVVDRNDDDVSYGQGKKLIQANEYRSGAYGHYLFLGGHKTVEHQRQHYPPEKPYPFPLELFTEVMHNGSTVICAHPITYCEFDDMTSWPGGGYARGLLTLLAAGLIDAVSITDCSCNSSKCKELWYNLLNLGLKIPAVAGGDVCLGDRPEFPAVGTWRTMATMKREINFEKFLSNIRKGRSLMSTGPIIQIDINGHQPGDRITNETGARILTITLDSPDTVDNIKIIVDGKVLKEFKVNSTHWEYQEQLAVGQGSWLAVECSGEGNWHYPHGLWAHTNPIYLSGKIEQSILMQSISYIICFINKLEDYLIKCGLNESERQMVVKLANRLLLIPKHLL